MMLLHAFHNRMFGVEITLGDRRRVILGTKPKSEHAERLRHLWKVRPEAEEDLPAAVLAAYRARVKAYRAWVGVDREADDRVESEAAYRAWVKAAPAWENVLIAHHDALEAWHAKHCPALHSPEGCRWDGKRLVGIGA